LSGVYSVADFLKRYLMAVIPERVLPSLGMEVDRINQGPVHVENGASDRRVPLVENGAALIHAGG